MRWVYAHRLALGAVIATIAAASVACSAIVDFANLSGTPTDAASDGHADDAATVGDATVTPDGASPAQDAGDAGDAGGANGGDGSTTAEGGNGCPGTHGPAMVSVGGYCIDSTEVTNDQYKPFVAQANTSTQPAVCAWNTTFAPSCLTLNAAPNAPVTCVNWCDAYAFCAWAGKRLCGKIGGGGTTTDLGALNDATKDQWFNACSQGGARTYPYGNTYMMVCNDAEHGASMPIDVATSTGCVGGFPGLFDMSGNAVEWEDGCVGTAGASDTCIIRSGAWDDSQAGGNLACASTSSALQMRNLADNTTGFRCCGP
jgi:formylglycine-generating enzyme required for sulfatase activity